MPKLLVNGSKPIKACERDGKQAEIISAKTIAGVRTPSRRSMTAPVLDLAHDAPFYSCEKIGPSKHGVNHLVSSNLH
jgi:hypothetical protein